MRAEPDKTDMNGPLKKNTVLANFFFFAGHARKLLVGPGARFFVLEYFYRSTRARFVVEVVFTNCSLIAGLTIVNARAPNLLVSS